MVAPTDIYIYYAYYNQKYVYYRPSLYPAANTYSHNTTTLYEETIVVMVATAVAAAAVRVAIRYHVCGVTDDDDDDDVDVADDVG